VCLALLAGPATAMPSEATATDDADAGRRDADEDAMFGGDEDEQEGENAEKSGKKPADAHEDFGDARMSEKATVKSELLDADKLQIGGLMYARNGVFFAEGIKFHNASLSQSTLTDIYLDARPNDRVRAFLRGRMLYSPVTTAASGASFFGVSSGSGPVTMQLDQLWINTDIARFVYVTVGAQRVRWGATRLWNPVDVINVTRRNPLTLFDQRLGVPMAKFHVPFEVKLFGETQAWNAYFLALTDSATDLERIGAAGRLEMVLGTTEIGLSAVKRKGSDARFGADVSAGIGDIDITGEFGANQDPKGDWHWLVSAGLQYGMNVGDDDTVYFGVEYFYNPEGAADAESAALSFIKPGIDAALAGKTPPPLAITPFYIGKHYASVFALAMGPGSWDDTTLTFNVVSNLSDRSAVGNFVISQRVHTDLSLELLAAVFFGRDGEFSGYADTMRPATEKALLSKKDALGMGGISDKDFLALPMVQQELDKMPAINAPQAQIMFNLRLGI